MVENTGQNSILILTKWRRDLCWRAGCALDQNEGINKLTKQLADPNHKPPAFASPTIEPSRPTTVSRAAAVRASRNRFNIFLDNASLWMYFVDGFCWLLGYFPSCPANDRFIDNSVWLMTHILGYARVSTPGQDLDAQRRRLNDVYAVRIFDDIISGKGFDRPGLTALLDFARPGDVLCVVRLDRLGRSLRQLLDTVHLLKERGIGLMSLEEKIDTSSAAGELVFHVFGAIAHFERRLIAERTRDGIAAARARGKVPGRPSLDASKRDAAFKLVDAGLSPTQAALQVGLGRSTVYRELRCRFEVPSIRETVSVEIS
jgi:DNA invertase Pin-like site-specific DNA recombinase